MLKSGGNPFVKAAITSNGPIGTLGSLIVDGRDHDLNGFLLSGTGSYGVSTKSTYSRGGNSKVGGTDKSVSPAQDIAPAKSGYNNVVQQNASWAAPTTPDQALNLPNGTLKGIAQTPGKGQYVTNPSNLTFPLSGVTYVELPAGGTWQSMDFGASSGILVVHNATTNAAIKNLNGGTFKGIIIADDMVHIHTDLYGEVIVLTPISSEGNCIGNGNGSVLYSNVAVTNAMNLVPGVQILSWREVR
jgi:hypothetical protein